MILHQQKQEAVGLCMSKAYLYHGLVAADLEHLPTADGTIWESELDDCMQ
jgi:hypothetical protein